MTVLAVGLLNCLAGLAESRADEITIAVAANFAAPLQTLVAQFERESGHQAVIASGSTGQLYAQIVNGAPFDILLAADAERPRLLAEAGLGDPASVFTYATGRLALWSRDAGRVQDDTLDSLPSAHFRWLALAEPAVAPYGLAAREVLENLGVYARLDAESRLVRGQNIAQTFAMVATGNAELGLVALSQAIAYEGTASYRIVPAGLHQPIRQDAILLSRASGDPAAAGFLEFLRSAAVLRQLEALGYGEASGPP